MGAADHMTADKYPSQGAYLNTRVRVCFDYDTARTFLGLVIREDTEAPGLMIIKLDDGRVLLTTECQWQPAPN